MVVGVYGLRGLTGVYGDGRQRGHQTTLVENRLDKRQHRVVDRDPLIELAVSEQVVDADGVFALEIVSRRPDVAFVLETQEVLGEGLAEVRFDRVLDDRVTVPL